jgi:hypothetical protein
MAATQLGTGGLTLGAPATAAAATIITVPVGCIVESVTVVPGGDVDKEDVMDSDGAFHSTLIYEKRMDNVTVVLVGKAYTKAKGETDGSGSAYEVTDVQVEHGKGALRTTVSLRKIKFA